MKEKTVDQNKFGFHWLNDGFDTAADLIAKVKMRMVKFAQMDVGPHGWNTDPAKMKLLHDAKASGAIIVGKRIEQNPDIEAPDMIAEAQRYYNGIGGAVSFTVMAQTYPEVDIWEGPNEIDIKTETRMRNYAKLLKEVSRLIMANTLRKAGIGGWSVGTPDFPMWAYYGDALEACKLGWAVLTRHSYGPLNVYYSYRHRLDEPEFEKLGYFNTPVYLSETGYDPLNDPALKDKGWRQVYGDIYGYWNNYLLPFTNEITKDQYVLGSAVFTCGNGGAGAFDRFDYAHTQLADAIMRNPPMTVTPVPLPPPSWATHQVVNCTALNVREFPWCGYVTPPISATALPVGTYISAKSVVKLQGMTYGWYLINSDGNNWISGAYLKPV